MKSFGYIASGALVVLALALGTSDTWAQARPHGGGGSGGGRPSGGGGGTAVSRGSGGGGSHSSGGSHTSGSSGGTRTAGPSSTSSGGSGTAVERGGSRSNYGHPAIGEAANRTTPYYGRHGRGYSYYPYDPYYLYGYGAFGLGAFYYDPFWWGYPYGYGYYGYPYGYGYGGYYGGYYDDPQDVDGVKGGLKLKVMPKEAEVYVDGYFVGSVDDYDGTFQRLNLVAGTHRIEIRAKGYEPLTVEVKIEPRETITYRGELQLQQAR